MWAPWSQGPARCLERGLAGLASSLTALVVVVVVHELAGAVRLAVPLALPGGPHMPCPPPALRATHGRCVANRWLTMSCWHGADRICISAALLCIMLLMPTQYRMGACFLVLNAGR